MARRRRVSGPRTTAADLYRLLTEQKLWSTATKSARDLFFISVANAHAAGVQLDAAGGLTTAYKYARETGHPERDDTVVVPKRSGILPASGAALVHDHLPATWAELQASAAQ